MSNVPLSHGMLIASRSDSAIADQPFPIVTQELKSFRDINVVDAEPGYILRVMVVENKATAASVGYTLSVVVTRSGRCSTKFRPQQGNAGVKN